MMWLALWGCAAKGDRIDPAALAAGLQSNPAAFHVVDVRTGMEFHGSGGHIQGAVSRPYPGVLWNTDGLGELGSGDTIVLICLTGHRSRFPLNAFRKAYPQATVVDLEGGMRAWWASELPTQQSVE